jgi:cytochrome o ubiquinol oxidase operon protein cyoD
MSKQPQRSKHDHGSLESYITGFVLSLLFTFIPYNLVVNHRLTTTTLLVTILAFGVVQMLVQVIFFLHLGRGPKPNYNLYFYIATVGLILVVVGGSVMIMNNLHYNMSPAEASKKLVNDENIYQISGQQTGACQQLGSNHQVVIKNGQVRPIHTSANKCDTLTFISLDSVGREIAFGDHPAHQAYVGQTDLPVTRMHNQTITLSQVGTYKFHDHLEEQIAGDFTVSP